MCAASFAIGCLYANIVGLTVPHLGRHIHSFEGLENATPAVMDIESAIAHEKISNRFGDCSPELQWFPSPVGDEWCLGTIFPWTNYHYVVSIDE